MGSSPFPIDILNRECYTLLMELNTIYSTVYPRVNDDEILAALFGETVNIRGLNYDYTLQYRTETGDFFMKFALGELTADENCIRNFNLV